MLVLLSFGLVLVATVLLVLGLLADSGLALIYLSIACSVIAGVLLVVATRVGRPRPAGFAEVAPAANPVPSPAPNPGLAPVSADVAEDIVFAPEPVRIEAAVVEVEVEDDFFPIADYDELSIPQILPLLPELYADELDVVEARERSGKDRTQVLDRLAQLRDELRDAPADATGATVAAAPVARDVPEATVAPEPTTKAAAANKPVATKQAPAKSPPATKAPATKAPATKAPAKKVAATTKKAPAVKQAPPAVKKTAAPVKKAVAPAPAKKAAVPAKKANAPATKAAAPVKKAAAPVKKAAGPAPAKKTAAPATKTTKAAKKA